MNFEKEIKECSWKGRSDFSSCHYCGDNIPKGVTRYFFKCGGDRYGNAIGLKFCPKCILDFGKAILKVVKESEIQKMNDYKKWVDIRVSYNQLSKKRKAELQKKYDEAKKQVERYEMVEEL